MAATRTVGLPFRLEAQGGYVRVGQEYGGSVSHTKDLYYSIDFSAQRWTPVVALASGYVVDLQEGIVDGAAASRGKGTADPSNGPSNIGNFITVYYPSLGVYATYAHLARGYVIPNERDSFSAGQILGYVGNTGWRTDTHLHVQMGARSIEWAAGTVADASQKYGVPVFHDTATGIIKEGIVAEIDFDLSWFGDRNLTLVGARNLNGWGTTSTNIMSGNRGANYLDGRGGNDDLYGGVGTDTLVGGTGIDRLYGGVGGDWLYGGDDNDKLYGEENSDTLVGGKNDDFLDGGSHNDRLYGEDGRDDLYGGAGIDILVGGAGRDTLQGGSSADYFVFGALSDAPSKASADVILDFSHSQGDRIDVSGIDADTRLGGNQSFTWIGASAFRHVAGDLRYSGGVLQADVNGDGVADLWVQVSGSPYLSPGDFFL